MSSRINAFILACGTALGATGCGTAPQYQGNPLSSITAGIRDAANSVSSGVQEAMRPSQSQGGQAPQAPQQQGQRSYPQGSPALHPAIQPYLNHIAEGRNQTAFDTARCSDSLLQGRGPSSAVTNPHAVGSVQGRAQQAVNQWGRRILGNGTAGQVISPTYEATVANAGAQARELNNACGSIGKVSQQFYIIDKAPVASQEGQFATGYNTLSTIMTRAANAGLVSGENAGAGNSAIIGRGLGQSQTIWGRKILNEVYTPKGNGAVWDFVR